MQPNQEQVMHAVAAIVGFYAVILLVVIVAIVVPTWFICKKAGFSPWLSFIVVIPFGGLVLLYVLAFADWRVVPVPQVMWGQPYPPPPLPPSPLPPQAIPPPQG